MGKKSRRTKKEGKGGDRVQKKEHGNLGMSGNRKKKQNHREEDQERSRTAERLEIAEYQTYMGREAVQKVENMYRDENER